MGDYFDDFNARDQQRRNQEQAQRDKAAWDRYYTEKNGAGSTGAGRALDTTSVDGLGGKLLVGLLVCVGLYLLAMTYLPPAISLPLHSFLGTLIPLAILAGIAAVVLMFAVQLAVVVVKAVWATVKVLLVVAAIFVVVTIAYNVVLWVR